VLAKQELARGFNYERRRPYEIVFAGKGMQPYLIWTYGPSKPVSSPRGCPTLVSFEKCTTRKNEETNEEIQ